MQTDAKQCNLSADDANDANDAKSPTLLADEERNSDVWEEGEL